jgi:hypothetical protein
MLLILIGGGRGSKNSPPFGRYDGANLTAKDAKDAKEMRGIGTADKRRWTQIIPMAEGQLASYWRQSAFIGGYIAFSPWRSWRPWRLHFLRPENRQNWLLLPGGGEKATSRVGFWHHSLI